MSYFGVAGHGWKPALDLKVESEISSASFVLLMPTSFVVEDNGYCQIATNTTSMTLHWWTTWYAGLGSPVFRRQDFPRHVADNGFDW